MNGNKIRLLGIALAAIGFSGFTMLWGFYGALAIAFIMVGWSLALNGKTNGK